MISKWEEKFIILLKKSNKSKEEIAEMQLARQKHVEELDEEVKFLLQDIRNNGLAIDHLWDLVNTSQAYPEAIEPLRKHLSRNYHIRNKEGIIRALGVKEAGMKEIYALLEQYGKIDNDEINFAIILSIHNILRTHKVKDLIQQTTDDESFIRLLIKNKKLEMMKFKKLFLENIQMVR